MKASLGSASAPPLQVGILLVVSLSLMLLPAALLDGPRMFLCSAVRPLQSLASSAMREGPARLGELLGAAAGGAQGRDATVRELRKKVEELEGRLVMQEELLRDARAKLANLTGDYAVMSDPVAIADVIAHDSSDWRKSLVIDKGSNAGVREGMIAYWNGALVGRISAVGPLCSRVRLIIEPASKVSARSARSRALGVVEGTGAGLCRMKYVGADDDVQAGDLIVTAGVDGVFPPHLPIGECVRSDKRGGELQRQVLVRPIISAARLECVVVAAWQPPDANPAPAP